MTEVLDRQARYDAMVADPGRAVVTSRADRPLEDEGLHFLHSARILGNACEKLRRFSVEGTRLNRQRVDEMVGRSLMLVTALSPVIGYDKASAIAHKANDEDLTLKEAALVSGDIDEKRFEEIVDPKKMVGHGVGGS
jgi:fumarate hydratase class II